MRISDWSSDVCSSDLDGPARRGRRRTCAPYRRSGPDCQARRDRRGEMTGFPARQKDDRLRAFDGEGIAMNAIAKTPVHLWAVGVLSLLWNAVGALDYMMTKLGNADYLSAFTPEQIAYFQGFPLWANIGWAFRSEEHTSELQSLMRISYAVFCLK